MNLSDITTQPYILALFKRDDGTRFLLGLGAYEFKDSQQHFIANTMVNDVVDMQGTDGALLAGQVRRASTQSFDGYVGDGGVIKSTVEQYRKDFIAYFQKNHFYTVVYIFADGTAIQRKRGYIIDSPEVKELYQMTPEYHVALNFEDVNYYKYAENSDGDEIYSNTANITSKITTTGGLVWSIMSAVPITGEGTRFTLYDTLAEENLQSVQLKGQTSQQTYTGKNKFIAGSSASVEWRCSYSKIGDNAIRVTANSGTFDSMYVQVNITGLTPNTTYTASAIPTVISGNTPENFGRLASGNPWVSGSTGRVTFTVSSTGIAQIIFYIASGGTNTFDGSEVYEFTDIQLESGSSASSFETYVGGTASPNPDYPQTVHTVTGEQTITISDGNSQSQSYTVNLGSIELCKIGDYQDYIYKSGDDWYVHKETGVVDLAQRTWTLENVNYKRCRDIPNIKYVSSNTQIGDAYASNYSIRQGSGLSAYPNWLAIDTAFVAVNVVDDTSVTPQGLFYYALATATDTQITDADLISDLNDLLGADTYSPSTAFEITTTNDLPAWLSVSAHSSSGGVVWDNIGATWEEGGEGGDSFVTVDSITDVFPTITIIGRANNPKITNITTGQVLQYAGNVARGQKLVIDVQQKTAKLSGTSVITNVSGDWLYLKPGINRIAYTIDNTTVNYATIEWQEITG